MYPAYSLFEVSSGSPSSRACDLRLSVSPAAVPPLDRRRVRFRTRTGLTCIGDGPDLAFRWRCASNPKATEWVAEVDERVTSAVLYTPEREPPATNGDTLIPHPGASPIIQVLLARHLGVRGAGALHHAAAAIRDDRLYLFPARSGTGKSTLCDLLDERAGFRSIGDDRIITRRDGIGFTGYGTPWMSTSRTAVNASAPLAAILFLEQAPETHVEQVDQAAAVERFLPVTDIPWWDATVSGEVLGYLEALTAEVPAYVLRFAPTPEVAGVVAGIDVQTC